MKNTAAATTAFLNGHSDDVKRIAELYALENARAYSRGLCTVAVLDSTGERMLDLAIGQGVVEDDDLDAEAFWGAFDEWYDGNGVQAGLARWMEDEGLSRDVADEICR